MLADLDECDESAPRRCDHVCVNTVGSFRCDCRPGFALQPDGRTCQPLGPCNDVFETRTRPTSDFGVVNARFFVARTGKPAGIAPDPTDGDFEFLAKKLAKLEKVF